MQCTNMFGQLFICYAHMRSLTKLNMQLICICIYINSYSHLSRTQSEGECILSRFTDIYNISKPTFRSCSILVAILYTSFRHAVPIFRFVSIFLIRVGAVNYQYIQRPRRKARTARRAGGGERLGMHRLSMQRLMSL